MNNLKKHISISDYAKRIGVSRQAILKAIKAARIPAVSINGKMHIHITDPEIIEYTAIQRSKNPAKHGQSVKKKKGGKSNRRQSASIKNKHSKQVKPISIRSPGIPEYLKKMADSGDLSFHQLTGLSKPEVDKIKIYEQIKQIRVKTQRDRKELISRKLVRVVFGKIHEIDMNEFQAVKTRVIPELAKLFGCTDSSLLLNAEKIIDDELWQVLKHVKHETDKFLERLGGEHE